MATVMHQSELSDVDSSDANLHEISWRRRSEKHHRNSASTLQASHTRGPFFLRAPLTLRINNKLEQAGDYIEDGSQTRINNATYV